MANVNRINLHISNIEICNALLDTTVAFIENLMENLDDVSKYSFAMDLMNKLDDLVQTCYDCADDSSQTVIDYLEDIGWDYSQLESYRTYSQVMSNYLYKPDTTLIEVEDLDEDVLTDGTDVTDEFGIKVSDCPVLTTQPLKGQLHFPNDYTDETALVKGVVKSYTPPVSNPAEERKKARAAYLAAVKQNTSQPT